MINKTWLGLFMTKYPWQELSRFADAGVRFVVPVYAVARRYDQKQYSCLHRITKTIGSHE